jgi:predicted DNA-binding protein
MPQKTRPMPFPIRLTPDLRRRLETLAKADRRTLTNYILTVLERHVETAEKTGVAEEARRRSED